MKKALIVTGGQTSRPFLNAAYNKNNYDYNFTLLTMNKIPTIFGTCVLLTENEALQSINICTRHNIYNVILRDNIIKT